MSRRAAWPVTPRRRRHRGVLVVVVTAGLCLGLAAAPGGAASAPSPLARLQAAAHGTLHGRFGTLAFHADGTATFAVRECGYLPVSPGYVRSLTDCAPDTATGRVAAVPTGYQLTEADGRVAMLSAYVDAGGVLHLGYGAVAQLAPDRTGTVDYAPGIELAVGPAGCVYSMEGGEPRAIPCSFTRVRSRTILEFPLPDAAVPGGQTVTGLVYLTGSRLLVSPELIDRVYTR